MAHCKKRALILTALFGACATTYGADNTLLFSLDIGSDTEISDPLSVAANEQLDPGDVYTSSAAAGSTGVPFLDDLAIFGGDVPPVQGVPATAAPIGVATSAYRDYFDMDGYDRLPSSLFEVGLNGQPMDTMLPTDLVSDLFGACVFSAEDLLISFHDDAAAAGWRIAAASRIPTEGGPAYGTNAGLDEVLLLNTTTGVFIGALSERAVHIDIAPGPGALQADDDDVDAIDYAGIDCTTHYFSPDHEGFAQLDPGAIYEVVAGAGPVLVVSPANLGLPPGTDIDAFEFAWLPTANMQRAFGVVFSVDADDPQTPLDESGGLNPNSVYASFLTGSNNEFVNGTMAGLDNIDGLATTPQDNTAMDSDLDGIPDAFDNCILVANPAQNDADGDGIGNMCDADFDNDCDTDLVDLIIFRNGYFSTNPVLDLNGDGFVNTADLVIFRNLFFLPPGPSGVQCICP